MKDNNKEDKSNSKLESKKNINENNKNNNNEINQIKYFHFNEVKKIVNNKNKKALIVKSNGDKQKNQIKTKIIRKEEEDSYRKNIYIKKLIITHSISSCNLIKTKYNLYQNKNNKIYAKNWNSTDERYKIINKFGLITKKFCIHIKVKSQIREI